jgi:hypothetical protein
MGPLQFLEPLAEFSGALSAGLSLIFALFMVANLGAPSVLLLLAFTPTQGVWRWPPTWSIPSIVASLLLSQFVPRSSEGLSPFWWLAFGMYGIWGFWVFLIGGCQLLLRLAKFVLTPAKPIGRVGSFGRWAYGWGAMVCASTSLVAAITGGGRGQVWHALWAAAVGLLGSLFLREGGSEPRTQLRQETSARLRWTVGSALVALLSPICLVLVAAWIVEGPQTAGGGLSRGVPLTLGALLLLALGAWLLRTSRSQSMPSRS